MPSKVNSRTSFPTRRWDDVRDADRRLLEALPIAAGIVGRGPDGLYLLQECNAKFVDIIAAPGLSSDERKTGLFDLGPLGDGLRGFFEEDAETREFGCRTSAQVGGRDLAVKLAALASKGDQRRCLMSVVDRTSEVQNERNLRSEMLRDSLTGLANRLAFAETIEAAMATSERSDSHAVLVVDMNRFSRINESLGALTGDELIITFARRLLSALRSGDTLARTGGNEFGILMALPGGLNDALVAADRILEAMMAPFRLSDMEIRVDCAVGCALVGEALGDAEAGFRNAQFAMKKAKLAGVPQVYEPLEASAARHRFSIETDLRRAIENDELTLAFQPLIDLSSGAVAGFEALARWDHATRGPVSPVEFIPVAEESGLILSLGRWALHAAARTMAQWDAKAARTLPIYIGVNVSAIQIARDDLAVAVADALKANGVEGSRFNLELTESAIVQDPRRAGRVLDALKGLHATVAMDDFGTGYSSLAYLQKLPIDVLKIDRSLVTGMMIDPDSVAIIRAVLSLAEALGMKTTAEGIETRELNETLASLGCSTGQGFYYAKPLAPEEALDYWLSRSELAAQA